MPLRPKRNLESYRRLKKHNTLYSTSILIGVSIAVYVYFFRFDYYSETILVRLTVLWLFPLVFGYYGFVAQWMQANFEKQQFRKPSDLLFSVSRKLPAILIRPIFNILHLPLFVPNKSPIFVAVAGSLIWSVWLLIFFELIFPRL